MGFDTLLLIHAACCLRVRLRWLTEALVMTAVRMMSDLYGSLPLTRQ